MTEQQRNGWITVHSNVCGRIESHLVPVNEIEHAGPAGIPGKDGITGWGLGVVAFIAALLGGLIARLLP